MNRMVLAGIGGALVVAGIGVGVVQARTEAASASPSIEASAGGSAWLHVRVDESRGKSGKGSKVRVNVPLAVVEAALEAAPQKFVEKGRIKLDMGRNDHDLSLQEMRRVWKELKDAGDTELVSVEEEDEHVTVARKGDVVQVRVTNTKDDQEQVHVDVPVNLVDAMLAGDSESVDVQAVIRELRSRRGDIVRVTDKNSAVRIWIDETAGGAGRE
jgi:hypothetical protein